MALNIKIEGMEDALKQFRKLEGAFADQKVESMLLVQAGQPLRAAIAAAAPRGKKGKIPGAIVARIGRRRAGFPSVYVAVDLKLIGAGAEQSRYPYMVEYGVAAHIKRAIMKPWLYLFGYKRVKQFATKGFAGRRYFRDALARMRGPIKANVTAGFQGLLRDAVPEAASYESAGFAD